MAEKKHILQNAKDCRKSVSRPLSASLVSHNSAAVYARQRFKHSKDS